jgi:hypothetical protein
VKRRSLIGLAHLPVRWRCGEEVAFSKLVRCVTHKASFATKQSLKHISPTLLTLQGAPQNLPRLFGYVTTTREKCRQVRAVFDPRDALRIPSPVPEECYSKVTYRTVHLALAALSPKLSNEPQSSYNSIATDSIHLQRSTCACTTFLKYLTLLRHSRYTEPSS